MAERRSRNIVRDLFIYLFILKIREDGGRVKEEFEGKNHEGEWCIPSRSKWDWKCGTMKAWIICSSIHGAFVEQASPHLLLYAWYAELSWSNASTDLCSLLFSAASSAILLLQQKIIFKDKTLFKPPPIRPVGEGKAYCCCRVCFFIWHPKFLMVPQSFLDLKEY